MSVLRHGRWLKLSVLANLFLSGAVLALGFTIATRPSVAEAETVRLAGAELRPDARRNFHALLTALHRSIPAKHAAAHSARHEAAMLLRAEQLDANALETALARVRTADMAVRTEIEHGMVPYLETLPHTDRSKLADAIEAR